ncbi:hypothetical protein OH807_24750 [Kitasatospora sp. NBC_01560]|uniref:hypothetical protein n=1 Tax=Kitasatospora sp. NBC_01560 TaxID=2975965 RepID=UPI00386838A8
MSTRDRDAAAYRPRAGEPVLDSRTGRTGIYMDTIGGEHYLRPAGGGREWTARPGQLAPAPIPIPAPEAAEAAGTADTTDAPVPDPAAPDPATPDPAATNRARLAARLAARNQDSRLNESQVA